MPLTFDGRYLDDDFSVYDDGLRVGRIMLNTSTPHGAHWTWHVNIEEAILGWCNGRAATLDEAKTAFRAAWQQSRPTMSTGRTRHGRERQEAEGRRPAEGLSAQREET